MYTLHEIHFKWFESAKLLQTTTIAILNACTHYLLVILSGSKAPKITIFNTFFELHLKKWAVTGLFPDLKKT